MSASILTSTKAALGLTPDQTSFDAEILMFINSALATLTQLKVGPPLGFVVQSEQDLWSDFLGLDPRLNPAMTYVFLRVRMLFDPPDIGFVLTAIKEQIKELEWRLNVEVDYALPTPPVLVPNGEVSDGGI